MGVLASERGTMEKLAMVVRVATQEMDAYMMAWPDIRCSHVQTSDASPPAPGGENATG